MTEKARSDFSAVVDEYARLEPDGADTWNPLLTDRELEHRLRLYEQLCLALRRTGADPTRLRVLDVGCGTGRSSRVFLDFGVPAERITGVDLRASALDVARRAHPGITYRVYDGDVLPVETASIDFVSVCTVMSSIPGNRLRRHLASEVERVLVSGGHVLVWDRREAKDFAGGDVLDPARLFPSMSVVADDGVRLENRAGGLAARPTHRACQFRKLGEDPDRASG